MTFWSGDKLADAGARSAIVTNFDPARIDCSAYQLTLGAECFVTPNFGDPQPRLKRKLENSETEVVIPPGQFAFLLTEEDIAMPDDAMGFISLRSGVKLQGLINVSGFHVDPGYQGKLIYSVFNAGPANIHLERGQAIFLLWLADLDRKSSPSYKKPNKKQITSINSKLISEVDRPLHSLQSLSGKVEQLQSELRLLYRVLAVLGVIIGLILAAWGLLPNRSNSEASPTIETV